MSETPKISVIVPIYNSGCYLRECLESILNQTYKNVEIIGIDDGSTDNSGSILDEYSAKYSNVIAVHKENGGIASARNVGLSYATGKYLTFVDSDDWLDEEMYERMIGAAERYKADIVSSSQKFDVKEKLISVTGNAQDVILYKYLIYGDVALWNKIFLYSEKVKQNLRFIEGDADQKACYDLFKMAERWVVVQGAWYNYRQDNQSYCRSGFSPIYLKNNRMSHLICKDAKKISKRCYRGAYYHLIHNEFNIINKVAIHGYKKPEYISVYEGKRKEMVRDIRKHLIPCMFTNYFTNKEKFQLCIVSISYSLFMHLKRNYVKNHGISQAAQKK